MTEIKKQENNNIKSNTTPQKFNNNQRSMNSHNPRRMSGRDGFINTVNRRPYNNSASRYSQQSMINKQQSNTALPLQATQQLVRVLSPLQQSIATNKAHDRRRPSSRKNIGAGSIGKSLERSMPSRQLKHTAGHERADSRRMTLAYSDTPEKTIIPPLKDGDIRTIFLGGVEEVGRNMTAVEYKNTIVIIDAGLQFKEESTPGADFILPNIKYLEDNKEKIKGVMITHGHLDHIGAVPYIMGSLGNPTIYTRLFTSLMLKKRQEEFSSLPPLDFQIVESNSRVTLGDLSVSFFAVTHSIPDSMGIIVETPYGDIVGTGDIRLDHIDGNVSETELQVYDEFKKRNVLLLMSDSTNAEEVGFSVSEQSVQNNIEEVIRTTPGRLIVGTFASQVDRILTIISLAKKYGKKIIFDGRSMKNNFEIIKTVGLFKENNDLIVPVEEIDSYPPDRIIALVTGAQGEEFGSLMRIANKTNKYIRINPRDTILMSSSIIPGNEREVQRLKDNLSRQGAALIHYKIMDIHYSGHANSEELAWIHSHINPKFFIPVHGYHYMLRVHAEIARRILPAENIIIPDNGMIVEIQEQGTKIVTLKESAPRNLVLVDGFSVGDIQEVILRDRVILSQDGIFIVVAILDTSSGKVLKSPDVISRGFIYLRESQDLLRRARLLTKQTVEDTAVGMRPVDFEYLKDTVTDTISKFLFQETAKRPIVIPLILGI